MRKDITIGYANRKLPDSYERLLDHVAHASNKIAGLEHRIKVVQEALLKAAMKPTPRNCCRNWASFSINTNWLAGITSNMKLKSS